MADKEQVIASETIYQGPIFSVEKQKVQLADGTTAQRDIVHHVLAVGVLPLVDEDHAILVRQWRAAAGDFVLEIPAGKVDSRDHGDQKAACEAAAIRELNEEIRYHPGHLEEFALGYEGVGFTDAQMAFYLASEMQPLSGDDKLPRDHGESLDLVTLSFAEMTTLYQDGKLNDIKTLMAYFYWTNWRMNNGR
ncbi:NUDIX hydrolase [Fructobacillus ficulneus]|uniref:ADP-ribose pyrophosphatase n=1 Tax=Fructobacillus ficulneus TaxID=157463 RepID=A0A0K8MK26_9LACO|nr:NUDIX hydrolase [Fructobacillus ficulneus]GAP00519.1 ADP-ribose pyrophosphatase [Fructobacillus ficulneus]